MLLRRLSVLRREKGRNLWLSSEESEVKFRQREWQGWLGVTAQDKELCKTETEFENTARGYMTVNTEEH